MSSKHDPAITLAEMLENIVRIETYLAGITREAFVNDGRTRDAVERCLERICEEAYRLGEQAALLAPAQPWSDVRGLGNRLRHAYDRISLDLVWDTISIDLPSMKADLSAALARLRSPPGATP